MRRRGGRWCRLGLLATCLTAVARPARADPPTSAPVDRSAYSLFNPLPDDQLRDFNPDRPSVTTGPYTVDAGHVQVEASFAQFTRDTTVARGGDDGQLLSVLPTEVRLGVLDRVEVDLTVVPFLYRRSSVQASPTSAGSGVAPRLGSDHAGGFGDLQLQAKVNLFGDDGGPAAFGVVPYLTLPTAAAHDGLGTGRVSGGVILPVQLNLPAEFSLGGQVEVDFPRNDANNGTGFDLLTTAVVGHPIVGPLATYVEYVGVAPVSLGHGYQAYADVGLTYALTPNVQLDAAVNLGLSRGTAQYTVLSGITVRW